MNQGKTLIIGKQDTRQDDGMIKALKLLWEWHDNLLKDEIYASELARRLGYKTPRYVENVLRLRFLSPKIQKMIVVGKQKLYWTNKHLFTIKSQNWVEQAQKIIGDILSVDISTGSIGHNYRSPCIYAWQDGE